METFASYILSLEAPGPGQIAPECLDCRMPMVPFSEAMAEAWPDAPTPSTLACAGCGNQREGSRFEVMAARIGHGFYEMDQYLCDDRNLALIKRARESTNAAELLHVVGPAIQGDCVAVQALILKRLVDIGQPEHATELAPRCPGVAWHEPALAAYLEAAS